jgi:hypothetical protein
MPRCKKKKVLMDIKAPFSCKYAEIIQTFDWATTLSPPPQPVPSLSPPMGYQGFKTPFRVPVDYTCNPHVITHVATQETDQKHYSQIIHGPYPRKVLVEWLK